MPFNQWPMQTVLKERSALDSRRRQIPLEAILPNLNKVANRDVLHQHHQGVPRQNRICFLQILLNLRAAVLAQ